MATAASPEDKFSCSVCLDLFTEPATIPESAAPSPVSAESGGVPCDFCPGEIKRGAVRSCLTCLGSYCEAHLQPHHENAVLKRHALVQPLRDFEQKLCKLHQRLLELYCRTDQSCICVLCQHSNHQDHTVILAERERAEKQLSAQKERAESEQVLSELIRSVERIRTEMGELIGAKEKAAVSRADEQREQLEQEIQELRKRKAEMEQLSKELGKRQAEIENLTEKRLKELETLKQAVESLKLSAQKERAESEQVLSELIRSVERIRTEVGELIGAKEKAAVSRADEQRKQLESRADEQRKQLEQEIQELRKRKAEMEQLSATEDHIHFLQSFQSVCAPPAAQQLFDNIDDSFWTLREAVTRLKDHLEGFWKIEFMKATIAVDVALDPHTVHPYLILSNDGKQVRPGDKLQPLPDNPKRFECSVFVLGKEGFTSGRHYWEVEVGEKIGWRLGVTRESSQRKGSLQVNPQQGFWTVLRDDECNSFHAATNPVTPLPKNLKPRKVGVYLDYEGGQLSFYNVKTRSLIYTFTDTFTEKLYPLFSPGLYCSGKNPAPVIICPHTYTG
ncbi:UNVERIFIED_CONTAM: hypothetical protein FKN15_009732 [Acipenser sinensis]